MATALGRCSSLVVARVMFLCGTGILADRIASTKDAGDAGCVDQGWFRCQQETDCLWCIRLAGIGERIMKGNTTKAILGGHACRIGFGQDAQKVFCSSVQAGIVQRLQSS